MNLPDIFNGATVFVDANISIYAVERRSPQCRQLLDRIDGEAVRAFSSSIVLAEVCHRRMINEAKGAGLVSGAKLVEQFSADERLWKKLEPRRRARRKLRPRRSPITLKKLDLAEFAKAKPPQDCISQWLAP